ncbi:uncharacterized protein PG986_014734 [Apiospora aurea]|uniref:Uncharacterized protein n=1 Tax=Apiospora aurea TaxID=335848 RepID=A0ABR1PTU7_9PEZI
MTFPALLFNVPNTFPIRHPINPFDPKNAIPLPKLRRIHDHGIPPYYKPSLEANCDELDGTAFVHVRGRKLDCVLIG